jgi:hypothetical protein
MGLKDFVKSELIEIIEFSDDSRDTLAFRFPDEDREIKRGAQLIVRAVRLPRPVRRPVSAGQAPAQHRQPAAVGDA